MTFATTLYAPGRCTPSRANHLRFEKGATTITELLVATALGLAAMGTVLAFNTAQIQTMQNQTVQIDLQTTARSIVDLFARETRRAGADPMCTKAVTPVVSASATEFRMQTDLNGNGAVDASTEDITYRFVNSMTTVERNTGSSAEALLSGADLTGSRFRYFDGTGAELVPSPSLTASQRAAVRRVRIELAVREAGVGSQSVYLTARAATDVELRNRFFNVTVTCS